MAHADRWSSSPCCRAVIYYARGEHGVSIGSCGTCGEMVSRVNPRTGQLEWLEGHHPDFEGPLRLMHGARPQRASSSGFTIIEILIVAAIACIIAANAIPALLRARRTAYDAQPVRSVQASSDDARRERSAEAAITCAPTQATADTWIFPCPDEEFAHAFYGWRTAHPGLEVRMVIPFAYRFDGDTRVLVIAGPRTQQ